MHYLNKELTKILKPTEIDYLVWLRIKEEIHAFKKPN